MGETILNITTPVKVRKDKDEKKSKRTAIYNVKKNRRAALKK